MEIRDFPPDKIEEVLATFTFPASLFQASSKVALLMTQSWCPQYALMKRWLEKDRSTGLHPDVTVFILEYDGFPSFDRFLDFKENELKNALIPYVRYYGNGIYLGDSNYVSPDIFYRRLEG